METTSYTENYLRLILLEVKAGTPVLRELLLGIIPSLSVRDIDEFLSNFKNEKKTKKHSISAEILFKTGAKKIENWDISLLAFVLIHCCTLEGQLTLELESNPKDIINKDVKRVNGGNIDQILNLNKGIIDQLNNENKITEEQYQLLFPSHSGKTDINTWDIGLLIRVLFQLCSSDTVETVRKACKTVLAREVRLCSKTVDLRVFLAKHKWKFDKLNQEGKLTQPQSEQLFPPNPGVPPDIDNFGDDVLIIVMLNACQPFSQKTRESIASIREIRNNLAHAGYSDINHDDFKTEWKILNNSIFNILDNELPQIRETVTCAVRDFETGPLDIRSSLVVLKDFYTNERDKHILEQLCRIESNSLSMGKTLKDQDAQIKALTTAVTDLQQRCPEPMFSKHRDIACFCVVFEVEGTSEEIVDDVEDFVKEAMEGNVVDENKRIVEILTQITETFSKHKTRIRIRRGSILLELKCVSIKGLLYTINTVNSTWLKQELNELAVLFSKLHKSPIQLSAFIPNSSLETIVDDIKRIDLECSPTKHQRFVEMELKASSVKGLVHVWQTLQGTELSSKLQTVSSILSSQHGEQVDIKVQLQPDTFQAALTSAEESISRYDQTEDNPVSVDESRENITPELYLQKTSIRADEDPGFGRAKRYVRGPQSTPTAELTEITSIRKVGSNMQYDTDKILGRGSSSQVYEGSFISEHTCSSGGIRIAVKCIDCINGTDATDTQRQFQKLYKEVEMMEKVEPHRNVNIVGYYGSQVQVDKLFIGFEFCQGTLRDYVKNELPYTDLRNLFKPIEANRCMVNGLNFLHERGIVHRDLKPENISIVHDGMRISKVVLGDFVSAKVTTDSLFSVTWALGTIGYIAPEAWDVISKLESNSEFKKYLNKKTDIFSLGILFYYSVTLGKHPYGNQMTSQLSIVQGKSPDLDRLENKNDPLCQLLEKMLANKEDDRPSSKEVCEHPALWNSKEILDFFVAKSDAFEAMVREDSTKSSILENAFVLPNGNWMRNLPSSLKSYLQQKKINGRKLYEGKESSVRYLLRAIRNITNHFRDFPSDVQSELGSYPDGHADFWMNYCPKLLIRVYEIL